MAHGTLRVTDPAPGVRLLTIHRPQALNALNPQVLRELMQALADASGDASVRALLLTGAGEKAFVAGADIAAMRAMSALEGREFAVQGHALMRALEMAPFPAIALVNGYALGGGCELALACDFIVASEKAVFGQPEVGLGIVPGFGGTQRLTRLVGKGMAVELCTTGRQVKADEALRIGLVNHVVAPAALLDKGLELAGQIAQKAPVAVKLAKHLVQRGQDMDLANANAFEADVFGVAFGTDDRVEGMGAFLEKRKAEFRGR
ncbi:MAG: short-chain-enoyl-CoA hydratase [Betaproteobacteria bacterium]|nr:MAG: short-chain-enoyl-CoA hydratase [Betaproteobacteria bacterium]